LLIEELAVYQSAINNQQSAISDSRIAD